MLLFSLLDILLGQPFLSFAHAQRCKKTPCAALFNKTVVDKLAKADKKINHVDETISYGNLTASDIVFN